MILEIQKIILAGVGLFKFIYELDPHSMEKTPQ